MDSDSVALAWARRENRYAAVTRGRWRGAGVGRAHLRLGGQRERLGQRLLVLRDRSAGGVGAAVAQPAVGLRRVHAVAVEGEAEGAARQRRDPKAAVLRRRRRARRGVDGDLRRRARAPLRRAVCRAGGRSAGADGGEPARAGAHQLPLDMLWAAGGRGAGVAREHGAEQRAGHGDRHDGSQRELAGRGAEYRRRWRRGAELRAQL